MGAAQARARLSPRARDPALDDAGLADGQPTHAGAVDDLAGCERREAAGRYGISREAQDEFALRSHRRAAAAWEDGFYSEWVVAMPGTELERDEGIRADTSIEKLSRLKPAFVQDGTVTAGNSSSLNDGAGALLMATEAGAAAAGRDPIARVVSRGAAGVDPDVFGIAPVEAAEIALRRAGIGWEQVDVVELNEAFASQCLADMSQWKGLDPEQGQPQRRGDRDRSPARRLRSARAGWAGARAAPPRWRVRRGRDLHRGRPGTGGRPGRHVDRWIKMRL